MNSVKPALWVQLVKHRGVKRKKEKEKTVSERGEGGGGSNGWVGGLLEADTERGRKQDRDRPTEKEAQQREERGRQSSSVSISHSPGSVASCFLPVRFPFWKDSTVWRKILEWWTTKGKPQPLRLITCGHCTTFGDWDYKAYREGKNSDNPRITEEWSLSRGKLTHGIIIYLHCYHCADSKAMEMCCTKAL